MKLKAMFRIPGSGNIVTKETPVSSFFKLHLGISGSVELIQSNEEKIVVECDDNLQENVTVQNSGRTLYVYIDRGIRSPSFTHFKLTVYFRQIDTLNISHEGDVTCTNQIVSNRPFYLEVNAHGNTSVNIKAPTLKCLFRCHGNVELKGETDEANIKTMMHGHLMAKELVAKKLNLNAMSHGHAEVYATGEISIKHMSHGNIHYYGPAALKDVRMYGHGELMHKDL